MGHDAGLGHLNEAFYALHKATHAPQHRSTTQAACNRQRRMTSVGSCFLLHLACLWPYSLSLRLGRFFITNTNPMWVAGSRNLPSPSSH